MNKETECVEIHILFFFYLDKKKFSLFGVKDKNKTIKI